MVISSCYMKPFHYFFFIFHGWKTSIMWSYMQINNGGSERHDQQRIHQRWKEVADRLHFITTTNHYWMTCFGLCTSGGRALPACHSRAGLALEPAAESSMKMKKKVSIIYSRSMHLLLRMRKCTNFRQRQMQTHTLSPHEQESIFSSPKLKRIEDDHFIPSLPFTYYFHLLLRCIDTATISYSRSPTCKIFVGW